MGYWKTKVLPKIKKVFDKDNTKKLAAAEACKSFDKSKEDITKEFDEKKADLSPKVIEIYEASTVEIKDLIKDPKEAGLKKHSVAVQTLLIKLSEIDFPGSKAVAETSSKLGPALIPGPVFFVFEKVSSFIVVEEKPRDFEPAVAVALAAETQAATAEEPVVTQDKEIVIEPPVEKKEEEIVVVPEPAATLSPEPPTKVVEPETAPAPKVVEPETVPPPKAAEPEATPPPKDAAPEAIPPPKAEEPTVTVPPKA